MALVDNQQGKCAVEQRQIARHGLYAAEYHFTGAVFLLQPGGKDIRLQPIGAVFGVVLRHQLLHVGQHQYPAARTLRQFGDHQAFACTGRQHNQRRLRMLAEMFDGGFDRFQLVGA
ncbi:hypothetical protein D3C79_971520 [compost metagenome]